MGLGMNLNRYHHPPRYGPPPQINNYPRHALRHNNFNHHQLHRHIHPAAVQPLLAPDFSPIPHVNPQFMMQQVVPPPIIVNTDFQMDYVPTPAVRLSPRSAE